MTSLRNAWRKHVLRKSSENSKNNLENAKALAALAVLGRRRNQRRRLNNQKRHRPEASLAHLLLFMPII